jgi:sugar phosphate permease
MGYLSFFIENWRFLTFGLLLTLCSSFGQTFFIGVYGTEFRGAFSLTHGDFGLIYSAATLASATCLVWLGRKLDDVDLRRYALLVSGGLVAACFLMGAVPMAIFLFVAIFGLRLTAQGLMGHVAFTTMARYFSHERGKAVGIATLGKAGGQALLPILAVLLMTAVGWRASWLIFGAVLAVVLVPLALWLLGDHAERHDRLLGEMAASADETNPERRQWSRAEVLRHPRFYLLLPAVLAPSFATTGLIFHQAHLVQSKGWSLTWFATCFIAFGTISLFTSLATGSLIDRAGARCLLPYYLMPLGLALLGLAAFDHPIMALIFMVGYGITAGARSTIINTLWAEVYGVIHLGAIRAVVQTCMVVTSGLAPASFGILIDRGVTIEAIALASLLVLVIGTILAGLAIRGAAPPSPAANPCRRRNLNRQYSRRRPEEEM